MKPHMTTPYSSPRLLGTDKATPSQRGSAPPGPSAKPPGTVPPPQHDIMTREVYVPPPETSRRPGADDHYKYRSLTATA